MKSIRAIPSFLIIGSQKGGTTALAFNLSMHPRIFVPTKEFDFFSRAGGDLSHYRKRLLARAPKGRRSGLIGEKTPVYMAREETLLRIRNHCPEIKLFVCLREPITRAYSRYQDILRDEPEKLRGESFETVMYRSMDKNYHWTRLGLYAEQLDWVYRYFPRERVCILIQERMKAHKQQEMNRAFEFLGVDPVELPFEERHTGKYCFECDPELLRELREYYREPNEKLFELLGERVPEWGGKEELRS